MKDNSKRLIYLDLLRMLAVFGVIIVHTSAMMVIQYPATNGIVWNSINVFNGLGRFAVPIFIMLTGGLLLDENHPLEIRSFYKNKLLYMVALLVGWVLFYGVFYAVLLPLLRNQSMSFEAFWNYLITFKGSDCPHLWYMFMIVGMYLSIPVFRLFVRKENKNIILGIIIVSFATQYLPKFLNMFSDLFGWTSSVSDFFDKFLLSSCGGFVGIMLTGWYLTQFTIDKKWRIVIYVLGVLSFVGSILLTQFLKESIPGIRGYTYIHFSFCPVMTATALMLLCKQLLQDKRGTPRVMSSIVDLSMGIYLIHVIYVELFYRVILPYTENLMHPILYLLIETAFVFVASYLTALLLSFTKFTRKLIFMKK